MLIAVTRQVSPTITRCELTHLAREPIDVPRAVSQHVAYEQALGALGATIVRVAPAPEQPDAVFIEDTGVVLDEVAVITRPGAASRRVETDAVAAVLTSYRTVHIMNPPATLDGGDVMRLRRTLYVGRSARTNAQGIEQLRGFVEPFDYRVVAVDFAGCLHLKSAVTSIADGMLLRNPAWVSAEPFRGHEALCVDDREPYAANALPIGGTLVYPSQYPRTRDRLAEGGHRLREVDCSEIVKAEGAVTCCSLVFEVAT